MSSISDFAKLKCRMYELDRINCIRAKSVHTICILLKRKHQREFISRDSCLLPISYLVSSFDITFVYRSLSLLRRFVNHSICPINVNAYKYFSYL